MTQWPSRKARQVLAALLRILSHPDRPDFVFSFHDGEEVGPRMLARIAKHTGLTPDDL